MSFNCSFLVNKSSIQKISDLLELGVAAAIPQPVDLFLRFLANEGHLRVGVTMPFVTSIPLDGITHSTIQNNGAMFRMSVALVRTVLFLDCEETASLEEAELYSKPKPDGRDELLLTATKLMLSPDYVIA